LGKISLGTLYAKAVEAKPNPMSVWATINLYMFPDPGAMADPIRDTMQLPTRIDLRA